MMETEIAYLKDRKTEIVNIIVSDIGNHRSQEPPPYVVSVVKCLVVDKFVHQCKSLTYLGNRGGKCNDPCVTPCAMSLMSDCMPAIDTYRNLLAKWKENQLFAIPLIHESFLSSIFLFTVSKNF